MHTWTYNNNKNNNNNNKTKPNKTKQNKTKQNKTRKDWNKRGKKVRVSLWPAFVCASVSGEELDRNNCFVEWNTRSKCLIKRRDGAHRAWATHGRTSERAGGHAPAPVVAWDITTTNKCQLRPDLYDQSVRFRCLHLWILKGRVFPSNFCRPANNNRKINRLILCFIFFVSLSRSFPSAECQTQTRTTILRRQMFIWPRLPVSRRVFVCLFIYLFWLSVVLLERRFVVSLGLGALRHLNIVDFQDCGASNLSRREHTWNAKRRRGVETRGHRDDVGV